MTFETGSEKYAWLNTVAAIAQVSLAPDGKAVIVDVFQVRTSQAICFEPMIVF